MLCPPSRMMLVCSTILTAVFGSLVCAICNRNCRVGLSSVYGNFGVWARWGLTMSSAGLGGQLGAELTDFVFILNDSNAVRTFAQSGR